MKTLISYYEHYMWYEYVPAVKEIMEFFNLRKTLENFNVLTYTF